MKDIIHTVLSLNLSAKWFYQVATKWPDPKKNGLALYYADMEYYMKQLREQLDALND